MLVKGKEDTNTTGTYTVMSADIDLHRFLAHKGTYQKMQRSLSKTPWYKLIKIIHVTQDSIFNTMAHVPLFHKLLFIVFEGGQRLHLRTRNNGIFTVQGPFGVQFFLNQVLLLLPIFKAHFCLALKKKMQDATATVNTNVQRRQRILETQTHTRKKYTFKLKKRMIATPFAQFSTEHSRVKQIIVPLYCL